MYYALPPDTEGRLGKDVWLDQYGGGRKEGTGICMPGVLQVVSGIFWGVQSLNCQFTEKSIVLSDTLMIQAT